MRKQPSSLHKSMAAVWAIDAYASHLAHHQDAMGLVQRKAGDDVETVFKDDLIGLDIYKSWHFQVLRDVSNAGKHGKLRKPKKKHRLVMSSGALEVIDYKGLWGWIQIPEHWGDMLSVHIDLLLKRDENMWEDRNGKTYQGQHFKSVAITAIVTTSLEMLNTVIMSPAIEKLKLPD